MSFIFIFLGSVSHISLPCPGSEHVHQWRNQTQCLTHRSSVSIHSVKLASYGNANPPHIWFHTKSHQALVMCSDLSQRDGRGLIVLVCQLAIIIIRFEGVSGSCSVQAPLCLTVAKICSLRDLNGQGYRVTQCLLPPSNIWMSLAAMGLMTCSSWPCLSSLASTRGARGPWSRGTHLFWEVIWSRTLCLPNPACLLILLSTVFNREPFTRVTPSKAVIRTLTPD